MAQGLISKKYLIDIAEAIRVKLDSSDTYSPSEMATAIANITGGTGTIVKSTNTDVGLITDTLMDDICDALRLKLGVQDTYLPSEIADAILTISGGLDIVPWATGTDAQIAAMVEAMDDGSLSIAETGWAIGDERTARLSAMSAAYGLEAQPEQDVVLVLMDTNHYDLVTPTSGGSTKDHFVVGMKNLLSTKGKMNTSRTSEGSWNSCARRSWCNNTFRNSLPSTLLPIFKQFTVITASNAGADTIQTASDYFALFAFKELKGSGDTAQEDSALTRVAYYTNHTQKKYTPSGEASYYFVRTPTAGTRFGAIDSTGGKSYENANGVLGISVFGCI